MTGSPQQLVNGLHWMLPHVEACIARTRAALEQHLEGPADPHSLKVAESELRLVAGAVGMIQCFGASLLAREMADLIEALIAEKVERIDDAFSTLSGASLQLSDYLDMVGHGEIDRVLVLQPTLNELRLTRGQPVWTESELGALQLADLGLAPVQTQGLGISSSGRSSVGGDSGQGAARRELMAIQVDFLQFFHRNQPTVALRRIARRAALVASSCVDDVLREYWTVTSALAESLPQDAFDSLEVKRLFGRSVGMLKTLAEQGEPVARINVREATYLLLVQLGRCPDLSPRGRSISAWYGLPQHLADTATIDALRDRLRGPNTTILSRVHEELEADFAQVKDSIDLYQRGQNRQGSSLGTGSSLQTTRARMLRVGRTLQMLGLPAMDTILRREAERIETLETEGGDWMPTATALLRIEHTLEDGLFRAIGRSPAAGTPMPERNEPPLEQDLREALIAMIREANVEFAVLKAGVETFLSSGEASELNVVPDSLHQIASCLTLINCHRGAGLVYRLETYARSGNLEQLSDPAVAARFADAVAADEYYLEAVRDELPDTERILVDMARFMDLLEPSFDAFDSEVLFTKAPSAVVATPAENYEAVALALPEENVEAILDLPADAVASEPVIDPEIREIFIEEAREVLEELRLRMRALEADPNNHELLAELRRGFHTLKGSGRMVGAKAIGEFSWAIENLLNRCLNGALQLRQPILDLIRRAIDSLPTLIEHFADPAQPAGRVDSLINRAEELLEGDDEQASDIFVIFREDARERVATLRGWLEAQDPSQDGFAVTEEVIRCFHTLRGSASIVKAVPIGTLAGALEGFLKAVQSTGRVLPLSALSLLADSVVTLGGWVDGWGELKIPENAVSDWLARIEAAKGDIATGHERQSEEAQHYAMAAFDEIGSAERQVRQALDAGTPIPAEAISALNRLTVSAAEIGDGAVARLALQFGQRLDDAPAMLDASYRAVILDAFEGLFQCLDHFRDGSTADIDSLLARLSALPLGSESEGAEEREMVEVFREEARDLLDDIDEAIRSAHAAPKNAGEALVSLRMAFHTLKGSARMVGLAEVGTAAGELEKHVLDIRTGLRLPTELALLMGEVEAFRAVLGEVRTGVPPIEPTSFTPSIPAEVEDAAIAMTAGDESAPETAEFFSTETALLVPGVEEAPPTSLIPEWPSDAAFDLIATPAADLDSDAIAASIGELWSETETETEQPVDAATELRLDAGTDWSSFDETPALPMADAPLAVEAEPRVAELSATELLASFEHPQSVAEPTPSVEPGLHGDYVLPDIDADSGVALPENAFLAGGASEVHEAIADPTPEAVLDPADDAFDLEAEFTRLAADPYSESPGVAEAGPEAGPFLSLESWTIDAETIPGAGLVTLTEPGTDAPATIGPISESPGSQTGTLEFESVAFDNSDGAYATGSTTVWLAEPSAGAESVLPHEMPDMAADFAIDSATWPGTGADDSASAHVELFDAEDDDLFIVAPVAPADTTLIESAPEKFEEPASISVDAAAFEHTQDPEAASIPPTPTETLESPAAEDLSWLNASPGWDDIALTGHEVMPETDHERVIEPDRDNEIASQWTAMPLAEFAEPEKAPVDEEPDAFGGPAVIEFKSAEFLVSEGKSMMESEAEPIDDELREIFFGEASELLDSLDAMLEAWHNGDESNAVREVQRALHTLKGGARMAGLASMGDAAHDLETLVDQAVAKPARDEEVFSVLRRRLEALQSMHDRLSAGHAIVVETTVPSAPEPTSVEPSEMASNEPVLTNWDPALFWQPDDELVGIGIPRREMARVPVEALDGMLNESGEVSIFCARLEQANLSLQVQLGEITQTIGRVREQLRMLDIETDAQITARGLNATTDNADQYAQDFDPLEMDRYSRMQELSRTLAESINDLAVLRTSMEDMLGENDALLGQQRRSTSQLQQGLMRTLMVPFSRQAPRLQRLVRQAAEETQKQVELRIDGIDAELDRNVLDRMIAPLEHLIRNAIIHGIESPEVRVQREKPPVGDLHIRLHREGTQLLLELADDGNGLDYAAIRKKAIENGLMPEYAKLSDTEVGHFIFEPGFSTAGSLTQSAGRGIGMDIVLSEVKQLGGTLELTSEPECGTRFLMRLPLTLAVNQALLVSVGSESFAIPLSSVDGIARVPRTGNDAWLMEGAPPVVYGDQSYRISYLSDLIGFPRILPADVRTLTAVLIRIGEGVGTTERHVAVVVDRLVGNREMVSKPIGPQVSPVPGIAGGTILPDGKVVMILDVPALYAERARRAALQVKVVVPEPDVDRRKTVLVVDDSVTMRRIAERLLTRSGYKVSTAKDGLDAMAHMQGERPDLIMLDIEMPRADGFEVATFIRNSPRLANLPVIMITSRSGEKHRERARSLGVNRYMIKPYQEDELLFEVGDLLKMESTDGR